MPKRGTNLYRREGTYYFRLAVPAPLRGMFGTGELRKSLGTGSRRHAQAVARRFAFELRTLFTELDPHMPKKATPQELRTLVDSYFRRALDEAELQLAAAAPVSIGELSGKVESLEATRNKYQLLLATGNHAVMADKARALVKKHDLDAPEGSQDFGFLCREFLKMAVNYFEVALARRHGDIRLERELAPALAVAPPASPAAPEAPALTLAELIQNYVAERKRGGTWTAKTEGDVRAALEHLTFILGPDTRVSALDKATLRGFKEKFLKMPPNRPKIAKYRGKTAEQVLAMRPEKTISATTFNNVLTHVAGLFNYGKDQGYMTDNPASGLALRTVTRADEEREAFTLADLAAIFGQDGYTADSFKSGWQFWLPLLGLYTGARLEELAQLHLEDIRQEQGVWVLDIRAGEGKRLKTAQSKRLVPLHRVLLEVVDLPTYAARLRRKGEERLFPDLEKKGEAERYGKAASQFFSRTVKRLGLDGKKSFHSFRHTFITRAKELGVDPVALMELDGHKVSGETFGRYGKRLGPDKLKERVLDPLDYPGLDLAHVSKCKFAR